MWRHTVILLLSLRAIAATYYVATTGNDTNPGTFASPFRTIDKGAQTAVAGDTVMVATGSYAENVDTAYHGGSAGSPITFDGQGVAETYRFYLHTNHINVQNFTLTGTAAGGNPIYVYRDGDNCIISNNVIDVKTNVNVLRAILFQTWLTDPWSDAGCDNLIISNTIKNFSGEVAIRIWGDRNVVYGNTLIDGDNCDWFHWWGRSNMFVGNLCSNVYYSGLNANHADLFQTFGDNNDGCYYTIIESNTFLAAHAFIEGGTNNCPQLCMLTTDGIPEISDLYIRNNVFIGIASKGTMNMSNVYWHNNLFVDCATNSYNGGHVLIFGDSFGAADNCHVVNNIFWNCGYPQSYTNTGWYTFKTNLNSVSANYNYVSKGTSFLPLNVDALHRSIGDPGGWDYPASMWWEDNGINGGDPGWTDYSTGDYTITVTSPLIGSAYEMNGVFTTDITGLVRGAAWDIGPYEYDDGSGSRVIRATTVRAGTIRGP